MVTVYCHSSTFISFLPIPLTFVTVCITVCSTVGLAKRFVVLYLKMQVVEKLAGVDD